MARKAVIDAFEARLAANWTATPIIPYDTQAQPPDNAEGFVVLQYPVANGGRPWLERRWWEIGTVRIVLNVLRGIGLDQGSAWSDELADIFRAVKFNSIETFVPDGPIIDDTIENGNWVEYSIIIPYRFEYFDA